MNKNVFKIVSVFVVCIILILLPNKSNTYDGLGNSLYVKNKVFVKTKTELGISEATGKISTVTGIPSIDKLNNQFKVKRIERVFELNNGDAETYRKLDMSRIYVFWFDENIDSYNVVDGYTKDDNIEYSEPVFTGFAAGQKESSENMFPDDTYFSMQWYLNNKGNVSPSSGGIAKKGEDINMIKAWDVEQGSDEMIVAILDSGIEDESPDLSGRLWINKGEVPNNGIDDDRNGYTDDYKGWDFAYEDKSAGDGFGHGTNIATVIGASSNNSFGFAGINSKCKLMNCKNLSDNNSGEYEWWAKSIKYAVDNGAKVINMSEGGDEFSKVLKTAVEYATLKNCVLVAAMMNKGDGRNYYPASYEGAFAVGATDTDGKRCKKFSWGGGSCWGKHIAVVAPGNKIYGVDYEDPYKFDTYWSGTSQSTAIVSALSSLLFAQDRTRSAEEVKKIIEQTAVDGVGDQSEDKKGFDMYYGYGRIDCFLALTYNDEITREKIANKYTNINKQEIKDEVIYEDNNTIKQNDDGGARSVKKNVNEREKKINSDPDKPAKKR